jgi:hypothetical protein
MPEKSLCFRHSPRRCRDSWGYRRGIHAVVNAVNQQIEIDALRRERFVGRDHGRGARAGVGIRRIVAQHAVLGVVAQIAVQRKRDVAVDCSWLSATTVRRGATAEPSTEKLTTGLLAPKFDGCWAVVPANTVTLSRASPPMVYVPVAPAGMACVKV